MSQVTLAKLNRLVTSAILSAEHMPRGTRAERVAYAKVSALEEQIADVLPADSIEGEIARRGAVSAAIRCGDRARARGLVDFYLKESSAVPPELAAALQAMLQISSNVAAPARMGRRAMLAALGAFRPGEPKDDRYVGVRCPECGRSDGGHNSRCPNRLEPVTT